MYFSRLTAVVAFLLSGPFLVFGQGSGAKVPVKVNSADSISEFMLRGAVMSLAAVQSKYEALEAGNNGNQILSRQKSGEAQNYFNQSRTFYRKVLIYDSLYAPAWNSLGTTYFLQDIPDQSLPYYRKAVALKPDYTVAMVNMGKAYSKMGKTDSALFYYRQSVKVDSTFVQGYIEQARVLSEVKQDQKGAISVLETATRYTTQNEVPYNMMAEIHFVQGDSAAGIAALEKVVRLNSGNVERALLLASWYGRHGDPVKQKEFQLLADKELKRIEEREKDHSSEK